LTVRAVDTRGMDAGSPPRQLKWTRAMLIGQRARIVLVAVLCAYFTLLWRLGGYEQWSKLGVNPPIGGWFGDLQNVTSAWDCTRKGIAVLPTNPCDFDNRPANYPRLWLLPYHLGLGHGDTFPLGLALAGIFLVAAVVVLPGRSSWLTTTIYASALCSAASMLGIERGNVDLFVFAIVSAALLAAGRRLRGTVVADALLLLAACLKLFPILALGFVAPVRARSARVGAVVVVICFAVYAIAIRKQLEQIGAAVPQEDYWSYGIRRVSKWMSAGIEGTHATRSSLPSWDVLLLVTSTAAGWAVSRRTRRQLMSQRTAAERRDLSLFWAGGCIYLGTYALARNYDYRLVFCLLTVPQLGRWAAARVRLAWIAIVALLGTMWLDGYYSWSLWSWLNEWSAWTAVGPNAQPLPLAAIAQLLLCFTYTSLLLATAPLVARNSRTRSGAGLPRPRCTEARSNEL
jgi:hypothetical protein